MEPDVEPDREPDVQPCMGERSGDGAASRPRVAHPANPGGGQVALETLLAAAIRGRADDAEAQTQAVAAFRAARDGGAHTARTRRRDDWRPGARRRPGRSLTAAFAALLAGLTLGGVAYAAIGPSSHDDGGAPGPSRGPALRQCSRPAPAAAPPVGPGAPGVAAPGGSRRPPGRARPGRRGPLPRVRVGQGRGDALDSKAWQRLVDGRGRRGQGRGVLRRATGRARRDQGRGRGEAENAETRGTGSPGTAGGTPVRRAGRDRSRRTPGPAVGHSGGQAGGRAGATGRAPGRRGGAAARATGVAGWSVEPGNGRGRHPPQERPRPSRGTGRAATRTLYSAGSCVFCHTSHASRVSCMLYEHGRGAVSGRNVPFAPGRGG